jgi:hypothetical protein
MTTAEAGGTAAHPVMIGGNAARFRRAARDRPGPAVFLKTTAWWYATPCESGSSGTDRRGDSVVERIHDSSDGPHY